MRLSDKSRLDYTLSMLRRTADAMLSWPVSPAEAAALVAEVNRLRAENERLRGEASYLRACVPPVHPGDYGHEAWAEAMRAAVAEERAVVVAWLREEFDTDSVRIAADDIERGEHRREEEG